MIPFFARSGNLSGNDDPVRPSTGTADPWSTTPVEVASVGFVGDSGDITTEGVLADGTRFSETVTIVGNGPGVLLQGGADVVRINRMAFLRADGLQNSQRIVARDPANPTISRCEVFVGGRGVSEWGVWAAALDRQFVMHSISASNNGANTNRGKIILWHRPWATPTTWHKITELSVTGGYTTPELTLGMTLQPGWEFKLTTEGSGDLGVMMLLEELRA